MKDDILELTKEQFEAFLRLPAVKATYTYVCKADPKNLANVPRSLLGRRWLRFAGIYYVVGESDG
jgi:hypothetical protein